MNLQADTHSRVLDRLLDGVLVVERGGAVAVFNPAAGRIFGLAPSEVLGRNFGELFIERDGFEAFTDLILDAVTADGEHGGRGLVTVRIGDGERSLSVATSYLKAGSGGEAASGALIAVFSDITELRELRETELRMAKTVAAQHADLQKAYVQIEERNEELTGMLKKVQAARISATALVAGVFLAAGVYVWQPLDPSAASATAQVASRTVAGELGGVRTLRVEPRPVRETMSFVGRLKPRRTVAIASPLGSHVVAVHVEQGQEVQAGDLLAELDTGETVRTYRRAQVAYMEALKAFETVRDWEEGHEMAGAKRSFTRSTMALKNQESRLQRTSFLFEEGLVSALEREDAERRYQSQLLDSEAARASYEAAHARGGEEVLNKATLQLRSAEEEMRELEEAVARGHVRAPVAGVILAPPVPGARMLAVGRQVDEGDALLAVGDFSRMVALTAVDEVDVVRIAAGQPVSVTGNAFSDLRLQGTVTHVASQPIPRTRGVTEFEVEVTLEALQPAQQERLRTGMTSNLEIVVYRNDAALLVPIEAVERRGGVYRLRVVDRETGAVREREVETGPTTLDTVEIAAGIEAGDEILMPAN